MLVLFLQLLLLLLLAAAPAFSQDPDPAAPDASGGDSPRVDLERLLKLPSSLDYSVEKRGGLTPGEWRSRFEEIRTALEKEREGLAGAEEDLDRAVEDFLSQGKLISDYLAVRAAEGKDVAGQLFWPKPDLSGMVGLRFKIPSSDADTEEREDFYRANRNVFRWRIARFDSRAAFAPWVRFSR